MSLKSRCGVIMAAALSLLLVFSCSKKEKKTESATADTTKTISYVSEEISFGVFFDKGGTKRTLTLDKGQKQVEMYIFVSIPKAVNVQSVEFRLSLPKGVTIENDKYYGKRVASMGTFEDGISETFPCFTGQKLLLHDLTLNVPPGLKDAEIALLPSLDGDFFGIATCDEGNPMLQAASYRGVINPTK